MVHILVAYKQFPAPSVGHAGGESLFGLMDALHRRGHTLTLVSRIREEERRYLPEVEAICDRVETVVHHRSRPGPRSIAVARSYLDFRRAVRRTVQAVQPDFMHVETTQTAAILLGLRRPPASYRTQDVNWYLQEQLRLRTEGVGRLMGWGKQQIFRCLEPWLCRQYELTLTVSEGDRALLAPLLDPERLLLVPLAPGLDPDAEVEPAVDGGPNLLFVGAMSRSHNLTGVTWFLDRIWPRIRKAQPDARFFIVGGGPPESLRARADDHVKVTGFVDDLASWYRAATLFVSPLLVAGGLLQKVMDAMAMGVPVVATNVCNHGLGAIPGEHLITADHPEPFADAVVSLLSDPEARGEVGRAGQSFVFEHYDIEPAVDRWEEAILACVGSEA